MSNLSDALQRSAPRALHEQLTAQLRQDFLARYRPGQQVPTEEAICRAYVLSRVTVRRAIRTLVDEGLLIRRQGKGTFLANQRQLVVYELDKLGAFVEAFADSGNDVSTRLLSFSWCGADEVPSPLAPATTALTWERLYETRGSPHAHLKIFLPPHLGDKVSRSDTEVLGIYQILLDKAGIKPARASFKISTQLPDQPLGDYLRISPTMPVITLQRVSFADDGSVIEHTIYHLRPDVYELSVNVLAR